MNYRHIFHAGNFADVMKHAVLVRVLLYFARKDAPYRVIDTHAGEGAYDLSRDEAARTGEWRGGIGRLAAINPASPKPARCSRRTAHWSAPATRRESQKPIRDRQEIAQVLMRKQDRAIFCELFAPAREKLVATLGHDGRIKCPALDGWTALKAFVPPPERRGLVLIDPPFEAADEFARLAETFGEAWKKWPTGTFLLWYPVKSRRIGNDLRAAIADFGVTNLLRLELGVAPVAQDGPLTRSGLIVVNPPFVLAEEMRVLLPVLAKTLGESGSGDFLIEPSAKI